MIFKQPTPLLAAIERYVSEEMYPLHTPGHKQGDYLSLSLKTLLEKPWQVDLTELPGLDDLHRPTAAIADSQQLAAKVFGAFQTFYLVQGATVGIHAAMLAAGMPGETFVVPRHAHRSVYAGMVLGGFKPIYLTPEFDKHWSIPLGVSVEKHRDEFPENSAALLISPTYQGVVPLLAQQIELLQQRKIPVVVDEAHGGHFKFAEALPKCALECGADVVIHGSHKTLPTMTQTAMAHAGNPQVAKKIEMFLDMLHTTSPSFLLLAALDSAQAKLAETGKQDWHETIKVAEEIRRFIRDISAFELLEEDYVRAMGMGGLDRTRLVIKADKADGYSLATLLRQEKLQVEMAGVKHVVLVLTPADIYDGALVIKKALSTVSKKLHSAPQNKAMAGTGVIFEDNFWGCQQLMLTPRQAAFSQCRCVPLAEAVGEVIGEPVIPYPPGIPLLWPGELFTREIFEKIRTLVKAGAQFQGVSDSSLAQISIISEAAD